MAIKRINTAIVGDYKFVCGEGYVHIEDMQGSELVHLSTTDFHDVVEWFITEGDPSISKPIAPPVKTEKSSPRPSKAHEEEVTYDPGDRKAVQTVSAGPALNPGESAETVDLAKLAKRPAQPNVIHVQRP